LTEQFLKSYEVEMAQDLGSLGTSIDKGTNNIEECPKQASSSKPDEYFLLRTKHQYSIEKPQKKYSTP
jgi:hypothetical protein